jgi:hypothetical protein
MFALDLFNTKYEKELSEGAVDNLEARRIDDLNMKMQDLLGRAKGANPKIKAALKHEFQRVKAERDSYFKINSATDVKENGNAHRQPKFDPRSGMPIGAQLSEFGGDATQFGTPTQSAPTTEQPPRRGYSIILTGKPGKDWMAEYAWQALETVFPREYPGNSSVSNYSGDKTVTPAMAKVLQAHNGPVVVKSGINSEDIAETLVAKLAANRVPAQAWRISSQDLEEGQGPAPARGVDANGRTQAQWLALVKAKFPPGGPVTVVKLLQAKMPDGPMTAHLSNGKQIRWSKVEQAVAEGKDNPYGYRKGQTVKLDNGTQGRVIDIFNDSIEVLLVGGRTVTVDFRDAQVISERGVAEGEVEMPTGQATGTGAQTDTPPSRSFAVKIIHDFPKQGKALIIWNALEDILPRDYPRVPFQKQTGNEPQSRVLADLQGDGFAIVKQNISSQDIAETIASKFEGKGIAAEVIDGGIYEEQGVAESQMSDLDIEYQDYKKVSPREFYNMYKMTKQAWLAKYKNMLPQQGVAEERRPYGDYPQSPRAFGAGNFQRIVRANMGNLPTVTLEFPKPKDNINLDKKGLALISDYYDSLENDSLKNYFIYRVLPSADEVLTVLKRLGWNQAVQPELPGIPTQGELPLQEKKKFDSKSEVATGDVKVARELQKLRAQYPAAKSDLEAVAKAEIDSSDRSQQQLTAIKGANTEQDRLLQQLIALDKKQGTEIGSLDNENSRLEQQLSYVEQTNAKLAQAIDQINKQAQSSGDIEPQSRTRRVIDLLPTAPADAQDQTQPEVANEPPEAPMINLPPTAPADDAPTAEPENPTQKSNAIGRMAQSLSSQPRRVQGIDRGPAPSIRGSNITDINQYRNDAVRRAQAAIADRNFAPLANQLVNKGVVTRTGTDESLNEFAAGGGGGSGDYFQALASAWYNGTFNTGSLQKGIKSKEDVERLLNRGIVAPDGKIRKYAIDYNSEFDGVVISSDDYYEHADYNDQGQEVDSRTGQKWGPYDYMEFSDEQLDESAKWRDPKYKGQLYTQEPPDYNDTREYDNARFNPKPKGYPGRKELPGGGEYNRTDPLRRGQGIGRSGIKNNINLSGKRKGLPSRDQITSLKGSIKDAHGTHTRPNLPEQGMAEGGSRYDDNRTGFGRDNTFRNQERNAGLENEQNNIQISINGRPWKVVPGKGYADSAEERQYLNGMRRWAEKKSTSSGKKWTVSLTGANPTVNELSNEKLGQYKQAAALDAGAADKRGDFERGNKRFSGIIKATKKQFANDVKKHKPTNEESSTASDAVERAILNRIMVAHTDLLMKFGPEKVMQAAEEVAYNVGDVDEIGTSDVSAYVNQVRQILGA